MLPRATSLLFVALAATGGLTAEALAAAPRYKMLLDSATPEHGVKTVSLVENPAIQRGWVALSAASLSSKLFHLSADDAPQKQVLTGPALLPGQEILRLDGKGEPFFIKFDAATIEATARQFAAQGRHNSTNQDHETALSGNVVYESWIVADAEKDKAAALGLSVEPGTWMLSIHIPDADYWQNEVKTGNKTGFSIEGLFDTQQLTLSAAQPASNPVIDWFKSLTAKLSKEKVKEFAVALGLEQLADGRAINIDDTTGAVTVAGPDGQPGEALPDGEYDLMNGGKLVVAGGIRQDGEGQPATDNQPVVADAATAAAPAPLPTDAAPLADPATEARVSGIEKTVNEILGLLKKDAPAANPATDPAGTKMAAALHKVALADLGTKLTELKLDAIELADGGKLVYNAITRQLRDADGALAESGYYAAADGSYFNVSTDQYIYEISKPTYDSVYLSQVELADVKAKLAKEPAGRVVKLHGEDTTQLAATMGGNATQKVGLSATAHLRAMQASAAE